MKTSSWVESEAASNENEKVVLVFCEVHLLFVWNCDYDSSFVRRNLRSNSVQHRKAKISVRTFVSTAKSKRPHLQVISPPPSSLLTTTTTTTATKMSRPLSRAQLKNWRRKVAAELKSINVLDCKILQQEMSLERMRRAFAALSKEMVVEEARFAAAEAQVLAAEASASQNQTGRLLFSSDTFFREFRWAVIKRRWVFALFACLFDLI